MSANDLPPSYESQNPAGTTPPSHFRAADYVKDGKKHLLLAASGTSVSVKLLEIVTAISSLPDTAIRIILTDAAKTFFSGSSPENPSIESLTHLPLVEGLYTDADETGNLYSELRTWADILIVAPLDANTLAKMTTGIADNLLLSVLRSWDPEGRLNPPGRERRNKYLVVAPAMDVATWMHPITKKQLHILEEDWADLREFQKEPGSVRSAQTEDYVVDMAPWAKILKPQSNQSMDWKDVVKEIVYHIRLFN